MTASTIIRARAALLPAGWRGPTELVVVDGVIDAVVDATGPVDDVVVAPGFVDLQVNGVLDLDCATADGDEWDELGRLQAAAGVTAWLPTLVTMPLEDYAAPLARIAAAMARTPTGACVLGAHLEGPFLGERPGAHRTEWIRPIDPQWLDGLPDHVRLVTLAAERPGATEAIAALSARGVVASVGHSDATAAEVRAATAAGATMVTHLFNAMSPLHHREPGVVGAALVDDRTTVGLIADDAHVHPDLYRLVFRAKGPGRVALVTDAVAWRSLSRRWRGLELRDGVPQLPDGTLAGSAVTMDRAVRNVVRAGVALEHALVAASTTPASVLGDTSRGTIGPGVRADLVVLEPDSLEVVRTYVAGEAVHVR